jgi:hypothetical protein
MQREGHHGDPDQNGADPQWKASHVMSGGEPRRGKVSGR